MQDMVEREAVHHSGKVLHPFTSPGPSVHFFQTLKMSFVHVQNVACMMQESESLSCKMWKINKGDKV